jgi:hypothetical protein
MANANLYLISVDKANGGTIEFRAILSPSEERAIHAQLDKQYEAGAVRDCMVVQCGTDEAVSYEEAMRKLAPR